MNSPVGIDAQTQYPDNAGPNRTTPCAETIAFIAIGADASLRAYGQTQGGHPQYPNLDSFNGHTGFMHTVTDPCLLLDMIGDVFFYQLQEGSGVFAYDIAEPFGVELAAMMLAKFDIPTDEQVDRLIASLFKDAGFPADMIEPTIKLARGWIKKAKATQQ